MSFNHERHHLLNSAHSIIETRLKMWGAFFATDHDASPVGATDDEYGLDNLIDTARDTDSLALHCLADQMVHAGQRYTVALNCRMYDVLMQDDKPEPPMLVRSGNPPAVTMEELDAALAGLAG